MAFKKKRINWGECVVPGVAFVFAALYFIQVHEAPMGAIYWPILIALMLLPIWILIIVNFGIKKDDQPQKVKFSISWFWKGGSKISIILVASICYLAFIPYLGFSITNFLFMFSIFRLLGNKNAFQNILISLIITLFLHISFITVMKLELPQLSIGSLSI